MYFRVSIYKANVYVSFVVELNHYIFLVNFIIFTKIVNAMGIDIVKELIGLKHVCWHSNTKP